MAQSPAASNLGRLMGCEVFSDSSKNYSLRHLFRAYNIVLKQHHTTREEIEMSSKASYEDYCVWVSHTSDDKPTRAGYDLTPASKLEKIKVESDRMRRIEAMYAKRNAKYSK